MTTPVFSEREISNIQRTSKSCGNCGGRGKVIAEIPTRFSVKNYSCQYATFLVRCSICGGSGAVGPVIADVKMAAAGGER